MNALHSIAFIATLFLSSLAAPFAAAQDPKGAPRGDDGVDPGAYDVRLRASSDTVVAGDDAELLLTIEVRRDTQIPSSLLSGVILDCKIDEQIGPKINEPAAGTVKVVAGTKIERRLKVDTDRLLPAPPKQDLVRVLVSWPSAAGASAMFQVAPNLREVAIDDLNLRQTRVLLVTNFGNMTVEFLPDKAPGTVKNFVQLAKDGFYDGTKFHRVIRNFMIQGGCPNTKEGATGIPGTGNPGYTIPAEFNDTRHTRGVLSMARSNDPNSAGCQFFIVHGDAPHLDGQYTAFARVAGGLDTLDKIAAVPVGPNSAGEMSQPLQPVHLYRAIVLPVFAKQ